MVDFISEVQEELRKDDYNKWMKRYGPYALAGIIAVIAGAGFMEWQKASAASKARATSLSYIAASEAAADGNIEKASAEFLAIKDAAGPGYAGLSLMRASELAFSQGDEARAVALLDEAAQTFETSRHQQLAQIKAAYILAGSGRYQDVASRVAPLAEKDQPFEYLARELMGFAAKESGQFDTAREQFTYLERIPGVPPSIKDRAKSYLNLMQVNAPVDIPAPEPVTAPETTPEPETTAGDE